MAKPSRLWKRLGATYPLFSVWNQHGLSANDHTVKSIKISRGADGPEGGVHPPTLSVDTTFLEQVRSGERIQVDLTTHGTNRLAALVGADPAKVRRRFYGRIGRQTVNDVDPTHQQTTFNAAGWEAQLKHIKALRGYFAGEAVSEIVRKLAYGQPVGLPYLPQWVFPASDDQYGYAAKQSTESITYANDIDKWTTDIGLYVQTRRDGTCYVLPHQYRWDKALALLNGGTHHPFTRSNAVSPATWEQPAENMPVRHRVYWNDSDGETYFTWGADTSTPITEYDMRHVRWLANQNQPMQTGRAYFHRNVPPRYNLPSLTFDVLMLANSPHISHRDQARELLELEVGDPVFLSNDWYQQLRGVMFAVGIEESITPDGWEITLNLAGSREVVGEVSPDVQGRTWEAAGYPWKAQPKPNTLWKDA